MTENLDSTNSSQEDYLAEPYITEDGLLVPPPTREMGPRRLARYRVDVADYLRSLRDGGELPEEPVEFMGELPKGEPGSSTREVFDRYQKLSGGQAVETETVEEVISSEDLADTSQPAAAQDESAAEEEVFAVEDFESPTESSAETVIDSDTVEIDEDGAGDDVQALDTSDEEASGEPATDETNATESKSSKTADGASSGEENRAPHRFDLIRAKAAQMRAGGPASQAIPEPVSALDSQGIDLEPLNQAEERAEHEKERGFSSLEKIKLAQKEREASQAEEKFELAEPVESSEESQAEQKITEVAKPAGEVDEDSTESSMEDPSAAAILETPEKSNSSTLWIGVMSIVVIIVLVLVWFIFFQ